MSEKLRTTTKTQISTAIALAIVVLALAVAAYTILSSMIRIEKPTSGAEVTTPENCSTKCGNVCTNFYLDPNNCGRCGNKCPSGNICNAGICIATSHVMPLGANPESCSTKCGNVCANLNIDPNNCGRCGNKCAGGSYCSSGLCVRP